MEDKLANMYNNMGYIWKGIYCFGHKPTTNRTEYTLFEKNNNKFYVHHFDRVNRIYTYSEKDVNGKKTVLQRKNWPEIV